MAGWLAGWRELLVGWSLLGRSARSQWQSPPCPSRCCLDARGGLPVVVVVGVVVGCGRRDHCLLRVAMVVEEARGLIMGRLSDDAYLLKRRKNTELMP